MRTFPTDLTILMLVRNPQCRRNLLIVWIVMEYFVKTEMWKENYNNLFREIPQLWVELFQSIPLLPICWARKNYSPHQILLLIFIKSIGTKACNATLDLAGKVDGQPQSTYIDAKTFHCLEGLTPRIAAKMSSIWD